MIEHDEISSLLPTLHCSVAERIQGDGDYRPKTLRNAAHEILHRDGDLKKYSSYSEHKIKSRSHFIVPGEAGTETRVYAHLKYNHTGIYLEAVQTYLFEVINKTKQKWRDGSVHAVDGAGWDRSDVKLGLTEIAIAVAEPFRRVVGGKAKWFTLCGSIGDSDDEAFVICNKLDHHSPNQSGELCAFANDLDGYYGNNSGYLRLRVTKIQD